MKRCYLLIFIIVLPLFAIQATFTPAKPMPVDIGAQPKPMPAPFMLARNDTLKYDSGVFTNSFGISSSGTPGVDETYGFATYFVLSEFGFSAPRKVGSILIHLDNVQGTDFRLYIWDDAGGVPHSHDTPIYVDMNALLGMSDVWTEYNLTADNIMLPDTFWVGMCYNILTNPADWELSIDEATPDTHTYGNLSGGSADWEPMSNYGYDKAFGVRVVLEEDHDVGLVAILEPPSLVKPNSIHEPEATYKNFGSNNETFDVYFVIDSSGTPVYSETKNITLDAGTDTTLAWPTWTAGPDADIVYDVITCTDLAGDEDLANDTLTSSTTTANLFWEVLHPPLPIANTGHSEAATDDGYYYIFGIGYDSTLIYDINNNVWMDGPHNPYGDAQYGTANYVNDKFYRIGGWDGSAALRRVDIYDPVATTWSAGAQSPQPLVSHITGVYRDSLIYCFGRGNWFSGVITDSSVYFYDTYNNTWGTATSFRRPRGFLAGGIVDSFAIVACGYNQQIGFLVDYVVGIIDQTNPSTINWGTPQNIPGIDSMARMGSCVDSRKNKELWMTCGAKWFDPINETWSYSFYTDTWTNWQVSKPQPVYDVTPIAIAPTTLGDFGLFVAGGCTANDTLDNHELFHNNVGIEEKPGRPTEPRIFGFATTMPNPTRGYMPIVYTTAQSGRVSLKVYDQTGRLVRTLVNRSREPVGTKTVYWNAKDDAHREVANGVYFIKLEAEGKTATHKLILVR